MDTREFTSFSVSHWIALIATALAAFILIRFERSSEPLSRKRKVEVGLGLLLIMSVLADPLTNLLRYTRCDGGSWDRAFLMVHENSYPFYLCDIVAIILAVALFRRSQRFAEIGYLWGVAGTLQGMITPTLYFDWDAPEYYAFFLQHGGVPVSALMLVFGLGLKPQRGAFLRVVLWGWLYMGCVMTLNALLGTNYGFLNGKPGVPTLFDYMGPYPWYLITLNVIACLLYGLLLLPFWIKRRSEHSQ